MAADVQGFEEGQAPRSPWCLTCDTRRAWPYRLQCAGCLLERVKPAETYEFRTVHYDTAALHAIIRRKVAQWEQACPGWLLEPDMQRYFEDATHPSKYVDRETSMGRKLAWTRFRVVRAHPKGVWMGPLRQGRGGTSPCETSELSSVGGVWQASRAAGRAVGRSPEMEHKTTARDRLKTRLQQVLEEDGAQGETATPAGFLADFLLHVLESYHRTLANREAWYGHPFVDVAGAQQPALEEGGDA